jgi:hypothetical protein
MSPNFLDFNNFIQIKFHKCMYFIKVIIYLNKQINAMKLKTIMHKYFAYILCELGNFTNTHW